MTVLIAAGAIFTIVALFLLRATIRQLRRGRIIRATGSVAFGAVSAALGTAAVLLCMSYLGYQRLTAEQEVAIIEFTHDADAAGALSRAGVRPPVQGRGRTR